VLKKYYIFTNATQRNTRAIYIYIYIYISGTIEIAAAAADDDDVITTERDNGRGTPGS